MTTFVWILVVILAFVLGIVGGAFISRQTMQKEQRKYPRLTPDAIREMMRQGGQKPSEAKIQQTYRNILKQARESEKKSKK